MEPFFTGFTIGAIVGVMFTVGFKIIKIKDTSEMFIDMDKKNEGKSIWR